MVGSWGNGGILGKFTDKADNLFAGNAFLLGLPLKCIHRLPGRLNVFLVLLNFLLGFQQLLLDSGLTRTAATQILVPKVIHLELEDKISIDGVFQVEPRFTKAFFPNRWICFRLLRTIFFVSLLALRSRSLSQGRRRYSHDLLQAYLCWRS